MRIKCKNCGHDFEGKFCNNCGQESNTGKLNFKFIWNDLQQGIFNFNRGLFFTVKQLASRPGYSIQEFIEGKRVNYTNPVSFVFVMATLYVALHHFFDISLVRNGSTTNEVFVSDLQRKIIASISDHYELYSLVLIPIYSIISFLLFRKQGYSFVEHVVLNIYVTGQRIFFHIVFFPLNFINAFHSTLRLNLIVVYIADLLLVFWCYSQFFSTLKKWKVLLLSILSRFILVVSLVVIISIILIIYKVLI